jgi:hypothetical protein
MSEGVTATSMPHSLKTAILAAAVSSVPPTMAPAWPMRRPGGGGAGDEAGDRLAAVRLDPARGLDLGGAADLADHDDAPGVGVVVEHADDVEVGGAVDRVAADADAGALADPRVVSW